MLLPRLFDNIVENIPPFFVLEPKFKSIFGGVFPTNTSFPRHPDDVAPKLGFKDIPPGSKSKFKPFFVGVPTNPSFPHHPDAPGFMVLIDPDQQERDEQNRMIFSHLLENPFEQHRSKDTDYVLEYFWGIAERIFKLDINYITPGCVTRNDYRVLMRSLFQDGVQFNQVKRVASVLFSEIEPNTDSEIAFFYYMFLVRSHLLPDANGRISRVIAAKVMGIADEEIDRLFNRADIFESWIDRLRVASDIDLTVVPDDLIANFIKYYKGLCHRPEVMELFGQIICGN